eukprot:COSAG04_NODE_29_length_36122_cov_73.422619_19_plen_238_part_00
MGCLWLTLHAGAGDRRAARRPRVAEGHLRLEGPRRLHHHQPPAGPQREPLSHCCCAKLACLTRAPWQACDFDTYAQIREAFQRFDADPELYVAIFTGVGERAFCAGSDIKSNFAGGGIDKLDKSDAATPEPPRESVGWHLGQVKKIVICGINGHANGGGLEQAIASDIRVAVRSAQLGMGEVRLGLLPGGGGTQRLPRLIPKGRAIEMLTTGQRIGAEEVGPNDRLPALCAAAAQAG